MGQNRKKSNENDQQLDMNAKCKHGSSNLVLQNLQILVPSVKNLTMHSVLGSHLCQQKWSELTLCSRY